MPEPEGRNLIRIYHPDHTGFCILQPNPSIMYTKTCFYLFLCLIITWGCQPQSSTAPATPKEINPAAEGFDLEGSDSQAIAIADKVMEAMGGRAAWDSTRVIQWTFFGNRVLVWDKETGNVRIDVPKNNMTYRVNIFSGKGDVYKEGEVMTEPDSLTKYLARAKSIWINDSYWIVMPFKLKDSGVTLTYMGEDTTQTGKGAHVLEMRFKDVGDTPQNKYRVWVDKASNLVSQWSYYPNAEDEEPRFVTPWADYQQYGKILLSSSRGERGMGGISVYDEPPTGMFDDM